MSMNASHQMTACTSVITRREALTVLVMSFSWWIQQIGESAWVCIVFLFSCLFVCSNTHLFICHGRFSANSKIESVNT